MPGFRFAFCYENRKHTQKQKETYREPSMCPSHGSAAIHPQPSCFTCAPPPSPPRGTWPSRGESHAEDAAVCSILQKTRGNFHLPRGRDTAMHLGAQGEASSLTPEEGASHRRLSTLRAEHTPRGSARATARHPAHLRALHSRPPLRAGDPSPPAALEGARGPGTRSPSSSFSLILNPLLLFLTSNWSSQNSQ